MAMEMNKGRGTDTKFRIEAIAKTGITFDRAE